MKFEKGFSLIELIVVITIIVVITAIGSVSYTAVNKNARDSRRKTDLEKIRIALEMAKQQNGAYPDANAAKEANLTGFMASWPSDPKSTTYKYEYIRLSSYTYNLRAYLESGGTSVGGTCGGAAVPCNYEVVNP